MFTAFSTALSGLNAMSSAIDVVGNNLANLNTTGYKDETVSFQDLVAASITGASSAAVGLGTAPPSTSANFVTGNITNTGGSYDAAINGAGFFVVNGTDGSQQYTRAGDFSVDSNGYLVTQNGDRVQGWMGSNGSINTSGAVGDIQVPAGSALAATASTEFSANLNLNASTADNATFTTSAVSVTDSLGNSVPLSITFTKTANTPGAWTYNVTSSEGTVTGGTGALQFDTSGNLTSPTSANGALPLTISGLSDHAANLNVKWNLYDSGTPNVTQYAETSSMSTPTVDGNPAGVLTGVSITNGGNILATYSNGAKSEVVAQLALASVRNPQSLVNVGDNNYILGADSATPTLGASGVGSLGTIDGGALESSTVDIATEFSNLLTYERSYQANSRVVTVSDELAQDAVNLIK